MKALIGHPVKKAKEIAKRELGVKKMGEARYQMILDEGVKRGDFIINNGMIQASTVESFFDFGVPEESQEEFQEDLHEEPQQVATKTLHPEVAHLDPKLSSSDLPRPGDLYHYRSYTGEVVQGEVKSTVCFAECQNPDGTWQTVAFQDLYLRSKGIPKETMLNHLNAYYQNNAHLRAERDALLKEIAQIKATKNKTSDE
jgi:hypothetical protein